MSAFTRVKKESNGKVGEKRNTLIPLHNKKDSSFVPVEGSSET